MSMYKLRTCRQDKFTPGQSEHFDAGDAFTSMLFLKINAFDSFSQTHLAAAC